MRLSIFPDAKAHPKSKEEKHEEAKKVSGKHLPKVVEIANDEELTKYVSSFAWSPFIFDGKRAAENFVSTDFLVYDIDEGMTIDECSHIVEALKLCCLCLPSPSHTEENQRFRIILPLARTLTEPEMYIATWQKGAKIFGVVDEQCKDLARYYYGSTTNDGFWLEGDFFQPVIHQPVKVESFVPSQTTMISVTEDLNDFYTKLYGEKREKVPEAVDFFVKNAHTGLSGKWTNSLNSFVFSLTLSGIDDSIIMDVCEQLAPEKLDKNDLGQIKRSIRDGKAAL